LQSLTLCSENFEDFEDYGDFLSSLSSTTSSSLRILTIQGWYSTEVAFPVEIFQNLSLTHFAFKFPTFDEASWKNLLQEIPKCSTLISLEFWNIEWWGSQQRKIAAVEFAMEVAQFLRNNPTILFTNKKGFIGIDFDGDGEDDVAYTTYIAPILEYHRLIVNLKTLRERGNYQVRGFLVAEAVGTRFAGKFSSCYTIVKANVDVLVSYLSSRDLTRGKKQTICSLHN